MPRLALKLMDNHDPHLRDAAMAVEAGGLSYATAVDLPGTGLPIVQRSMLAAVVWFAYGRVLESM